mmetsp:Transcript_2571/g.6178  ORF Transcript_2571/g.6178 Transcript_2571/m.6178 type:complete len:348 (+) Transcript_2571:6399-7442(+)
MRNCCLSLRLAPLSSKLGSTPFCTRSSSALLDRGGGDLRAVVWRCALSPLLPVNSESPDPTEIVECPDTSDNVSWEFDNDNLSRRWRSSACKLDTSTTDSEALRRALLALNLASMSSTRSQRDSALVSDDILSFLSLLRRALDIEAPSSSLLGDRSLSRCDLARLGFDCASALLTRSLGTRPASSNSFLEIAGVLRCCLGEDNVSPFAFASRNSRLLNLCSIRLASFRPGDLLPSSLRSRRSCRILLARIPRMRSSSSSWFGVDTDARERPDFAEASSAAASRTRLTRSDREVGLYARLRERSLAAIPACDDGRLSDSKFSLVAASPGRRDCLLPRDDSECELEPSG